MIKGLKIVGLMAFLVAFAACEKVEKPVVSDDPFVNADYDSQNRLQGSNDPSGNPITGAVGDITDPNEDEDFDGIVDPEEDEDFDDAGDDDSIVDPEEDEDFDDDGK